MNTTHMLTDWPDLENFSWQQISLNTKKRLRLVLFWFWFDFALHLLALLLSHNAKLIDWESHFQMFRTITISKYASREELLQSAMKAFVVTQVSRLLIVKHFWTRCLYKRWKWNCIKNFSFRTRKTSIFLMWMDLMKVYILWISLLDHG